jgi:hypothetical protein
LTLDTTTRIPAPFLRTEFVEGDGRFSPDGRFIAYFSDETGRAEVSPPITVVFNWQSLLPDGSQ